MPKVDWEAVLRNHRIEYIDRGPDVKRGNINIHCPFCGAADSEHHMGLDLDTGYWGCWRNAKHRGRSPHRLLVQLLGISYADAEEIVNDSSKVISTLEDLKSRVNEVLGKPTKTKVEKIRFPEEFLPVRGCPRARKYLADRGFRKRDIPSISKQYALMFANTGDWSGRLVFPVISVHYELVGWTGRAIGKSTLRYLAHPKGNAVKYHAYNGQNVQEGGKVLVIVEGPVDTIKLDFYGQDQGVRAIGLMSTSMKPQQAASIISLAKNFDRVRILFDLGVSSQELELPSQLPGLSVKKAPLLDKPKAYSDPGAIPHSCIDRQIALILKS